MMRMEEFDVIIIGAGPAGLRAAIKLAEQKANVLCIDKKQEIGVPKRCGEGLGIGWFEKLGLKPDRRWAIQPIYGAALYSPSGKMVEVKFNEASGYILERRVFEKELAKEAARKGAKIRCKCHAAGFKRSSGKVIVDCIQDGEPVQYAAPLIIAADGTESLAARKMGLDTAIKLDDIDSGYQYEMAGIEFNHPEYIHLFFGNDVARRGYVWVFPKGKNEANVGVGVSGTAGATAKSYLDKFISSHDGLRNGSIIEVNAGSIPVGGFLEDMAADNLLVIGDAAHQVNPIHGGGIGIAMEAADVASGVAAKALKANNFSHSFLQQYNSQWYERRGNKLKGILKRRHMLESLSDKDFETIANSFTGSDVLKIAEGDLLQSAKIVAKKLVRHPKLAKIMLKYLK